jgi:hypothetical protein
MSEKSDVTNDLIYERGVTEVVTVISTGKWLGNEKRSAITEVHFNPGRYNQSQLYSSSYSVGITLQNTYLAVLEGQIIFQDGGKFKGTNRNIGRNDSEINCRSCY